MRAYQIALLLSISLGAAEEVDAVQESGWGLAGEIGTGGFSGHAQSIGSAPEASGHPSGATIWGLRLDRTGRTMRASLGVLVASTGVEFESSDLSVESKGVLDLLEVTAEMSLAALRSGSAALRVHGGAVIDRWSPEGDESRTRVGGVTGVSIETPFSRRLRMQVRWDVLLSGSLFDQDDLPSEFERTAGVRQRWALGLRYGL